MVVQVLFYSGHVFSKIGYLHREYIYNNRNKYKRQGKRYKYGRNPPNLAGF